MKNILKKLAVCMIAMAMLMSVRAILVTDVSAEADTTYPYNLTLVDNLNSTKKYIRSTSNIFYLADKNPTRDGYVFEGWNTKEDGSGVTYTKSYTGSGVTLYAKWTPNHQYSIAFDGNGSTSGSMSSLTDCDYGSSYILPANQFELPDYTFTGWNTMKNGSGTTYQDKASVKNLSLTDGDTVTLYAQWKPTEYDITYVLDGGTNNTTNPSSYTGTSTIYLKDPTKTGYTFGGWYKNSSFTTSVSTIAKGSTGDLTLYAKWTPITYTIKFDGNGSTSGSMSSMTGLEYDEDYWLNDNTFKRTGYTFDHWNIRANDGGMDYDDGELVWNLASEDDAVITLYAQWEPITYTIKFDANAYGYEEGSMSDMKLEYDEATTLMTNNYTFYGYTFGGWNTASDGSGTSYADKASVKNLTTTAGGTITLYAQWYPNYYYLNLDGNGSTSGSYTGKYWGYTDMNYNLPANVYERTGYAFAGWNTNKDGSGESFADKGSIWGVAEYDGVTYSLYAQWTPVTYTITYHLNSGTNDSKNPSSYTIESSDITLKNPTRSGYTFKGWYSDSAFTTAVSTIKKGSYGNLDLYANWEQNAKQETTSSQTTTSNQGTSSTQEQTTTKKQAVYTIKFNGNGSTSGSMSAMKNCSYDTSYTLSQNKFKKKGYTFTGWNTQKDGSGKKYADAASVKNLANKSSKTITLYAQWATVDYSITYVLNGGTNNVKNPSGYKTSQKVTLAKPTKEGYTFKGWYSDKKCTKKVTSIKKGSSGNKKFYAKWSLNTYTIVFDGNGSTGGSMSSKKSLAYTKSYTLAKNKFTRKGYTFAGWNTEKDGSGTSYTNAASVKKLTAKNKGKITLYAQWTKNKEEKTTVTCPTCDGKKTVSCKKCDAGKVYCSTCGGNGFTIVPGQAKVDCTVCGATGKLDCTTCGGDGKVTCSTCNGKGTVTK
jgi:uncharacterized repeat protein (TIGR02543 family)